MDRLEKIGKLVREWQSRPGDLDYSRCSDLEKDCFDTLIKIVEVLDLGKTCRCGADVDTCLLNQEVNGVHLAHVAGE